LVDEGEVFIHAQRDGEQSTADIRIPRRTFDRMVDWYLKDQKVRS